MGGAFPLKATSPVATAGANSRCCWLPGGATWSSSTKNPTESTAQLTRHGPHANPVHEAEVEEGAAGGPQPQLQDPLPQQGRRLQATSPLSRLRRARCSSVGLDEG